MSCALVASVFAMKTPGSSAVAGIRTNSQSSGPRRGSGRASFFGPIRAVPQPNGPASVNELPGSGRGKSAIVAGKTLLTSAPVFSSITLTKTLTADGRRFRTAALRTRTVNRREPNPSFPPIGWFSLCRFGRTTLIPYRPVPRCCQTTRAVSA